MELMENSQLSSFVFLSWTSSKAVSNISDRGSETVNILLSIHRKEKIIDAILSRTTPRMSQQEVATL
jgi:hypothetical protein